MVALSPQIRAEVAEKMRTKKSVRDWMRLSDAEIEQFVADLPAILGIELLKGNVETLGVVKADPTDDKIIAAAVEAGASYIVSEDPHLLDLGEYEGIKIVNREQLDTALDRLGVAKGKQKKPR